MGAAEGLGGSIHNRLKYSFRVIIQLIVPDAQDCPTLLPEIRIAPLISFRLGMLTAIQLDDQLRLSAGKISKVGTDRKLAREFRPKAGEESPEFAFMLRRMVAQTAGALCLVERNAAALGVRTSCDRRFAHPPLTPPFQGGE